MTFTEFLGSRNWSRKAQIVLLTIAGIVWVCQINDIEANVRIYACLMIFGTGLAGVLAQAVLDWKHPKRRNGDLAATVEKAIIDDLDANGPIRQRLELLKQPAKD